MEDDALCESSNPDGFSAMQGKSKGYPDRHFVLFRSAGTRAFFVYGFARSQRANIDEDEAEQFKEAASHVLWLTENQLAAFLKRGDFVEVKPNEQEV